jgi:hypothetical protein
VAKTPDAPVSGAELVLERKVRLAGRTPGGVFPSAFKFTVWRLPRGVPAGTPSWMSSFRLDEGYTRHSFDFVGMDDLDALEKCLAHANHVLTSLSAECQVWIGDDPEYPFDALKSQVTFRSSKLGT